MICDVADCPTPVVYRCDCKRCVREPDADEKFYACHAHCGEVNEKHKRVRGFPTEWKYIGGVA